MLKISANHDFSIEQLKILTHGLDENAKLKRGHAPMQDFGFFLFDENHMTVGGCNGILYYGCLFIDQLWIDPKYRSQGYGSKLLTTAEQYGKERGCLFCNIETMEWEALGFYQKHGYHIEMERHGYINNTLMYLLRKDL